MCELNFWYGNSTNFNFPAEPVAAYSGFFLSLIALIGPPYGATSLPLKFWLANASLFVCGVGTFLFHASDRTRESPIGINPIQWDGFTMALTTSTTLMLFMNKWMYQGGAYLIIFYLVFSVYSSDTLSFHWLWFKTMVNGYPVIMYVQYLIFVAPYAYMLMYICLNYDQYIPLILSILIAVAAWTIDQYGCKGVPLLAFSHAIWHVAIGYASSLFICYGLTRHGYEMENMWWPIIVKEYKKG